MGEMSSRMGNGGKGNSSQVAASGMGMPALCLRAQISLEAMLFLSALLAFFIAMAPGITDVAATAKHALEARQMEFAFEKVVFVIEEAKALGIGSEIRQAVHFPVACEISVLGGKMQGKYELAGGKKVFERMVEETVVMGPTKLEEGKYGMVVAAGKGGIKLRFAAEKS